jgi:hypothetical protein
VIRVDGSLLTSKLFCYFVLMHKFFKLYFFIIFLVAEVTLGSPFFWWHHPMWGEEHFPCCVGCLCIHHEGCEISCFMWTNSCFFVAYLLVFALISQHCGFWWMVFGCCLTSSSLTPFEKNWFCKITLSHGVAMTVMVQAKDDFYWSIHSRHIFPFSHKGCWVFALTSG